MHQTDRPHLRALAERATPGPWELQTSNSWRRIGTAGARFADGDVLAPTTHRGDNHPDLAARQEDLDFIVAADPATVMVLLDEIDRFKAENVELLSALQQAQMALIGYLPAHRNDITSAAIDRAQAAIDTMSAKRA